MYRRGLGRTEVLIGVAVLSVLGLIAVPLVWSLGNNSARQEVPLVVESIRAAEFAYHDPFGEYVSAESAPREPHLVDENPVAWASNGGFDKLGWKPGDVGLDTIYGSYKVATTKDGFTVIGTCDIDGDGERAIYEATAEAEATAKTASNVY